MADSDFSELVRLEADLGEVAANVGPFLRSAIMKTAGSIKADAAKSVGSSDMWKGAAGAIGYDIVAAPGEAQSTLTAHIGYDKSRAGGKLGNLREFGAPDAKYGGKLVPLAPHNDLLNALEANSEDFQRGIAAALTDAEGKSGL